MRARAITDSGDSGRSIELRMSPRSCRARVRVAVVLFACSLAGARAAQAQEDDEVIVDPEAPSSLSGSDGEEIISDPEAPGGGGGSGDEDYGWGEAANLGQGDAPSAPASVADEYDPQANTGLARIEADGRFAADVNHEGKLEDAYETRFRLDVDVEFRRSRKLRIGVGVRTDVFWAVPSGNDPSLTYVYNDFSQDPNDPRRLRTDYTPFDQDRFELDIIPLAAYVDGTLGDGFHVRVGVQPVSMARTDFFSPIDMLTVYDGRGQPRLDPGTPKIAQPAVRVDWDLSSWATIQAIYVPWFMPHLQRPNRDGTVSDQLGIQGGTVQPGLDRVIDPSWQPRASEWGGRFVGPAPDFTTPQAQLRLNMRGPSYELGVSGGTALEKLPSFYATPAFEEFIRTGNANEVIDVLGSLPGPRQPQDESLPWEPQGRLFDVEYHRYAQIGLDGSIDVAPVRLAFELTYSPSRHFYAARRDGKGLPQPDTSAPIIDAEFDDEGNFISQSNVQDRSIRKGAQTVQAVLHMDWIHGETFALAVEGFWLNALRLPHDEDRDWWAFKRGTGAFLAGVLGATYRLNDGQWSFETSLIALLGPSVISISQIELRVMQGFFVNIGAMIYEGPRGAPRTPDLSLGGLLSGYDQVFVGFRYLP